MKTKLFLLFLFMIGTVSAQKEIKPYTYSKQDDNTIIVYASPSSVNNVTFTLKDAKDETLKDSQENDLKFTVFPFEEVRFRAKFNEQIEKVKDTIIRKAFYYDAKATNVDANSKVRQENVREIRTMFQFFKSLIESAYEYDNEPIAGTLSYNMSPKVSKKNVDDFNTDVFFEIKAKKIFNLINDKTSPEKLKDELDKDSFLREIDAITYEKYLDYYKYMSYDKFLIYSDKNFKFKKYLKEQLTIEYNHYKIKELIKNLSFTAYFNADKTIRELDYSKTVLNQNIVKNEENAEKIKLLELLIQIIDDINSVEHNYLFKQYLFEVYYKQGLLKEQIAFKEKYKDIFQEYDLLKNKYKNSKLTDNKPENFLKEDRYRINRNLEKLNPIDNSKTIDSLKVELKTNDSIRASEYIKLHDAIIDLRNPLINFPLWELDVSEDNGIQIEFNDGFLEHIEVVGYIKQPYVDFSTMKYDDLKDKPVFGSFNNSISEIEKTLQNIFKEDKVREFFREQEKEIKFENNFPFGFSSKADYADLYGYEIHFYRGFDKSYTLKMSDVLSLYKQKHQLDRLDFSPKNVTIQLPENDIDKNGKIELKKEKSSKILSARIYSDFLGFKEKNPNGLIQVEVDKLIPIWTKRHPVEHKRFLGLWPPFGRGSNIGGFNYANFNLTWAKIGDEDRNLQVKYRDQYINNEYKPSKYITYLDIVERENISVGVDLNLVTLDLPIVKTRLEINYGIHYGRIKVIDSLKNGNVPLTNFFNKDVNTIRHYPDVIVRIRPEERFGGYIRFRPFRIIVPNEDEFFSVSSAKDFVEDESLTKGWLHRYELSAHYTPSVESDNRFFFRYKYTNAANFEENGYSEFQVGYLMYLKF